MKKNSLASPPPLTLDLLPAGARCIVQKVSARNISLCNKLLSLGLVAGAALEVLAVAPLGDPISIRALGSRLSLRLSEAHEVKVVIDSGSISSGTTNSGTTNSGTTNSGTTNSGAVNSDS